MTNGSERTPKARIQESVMLRLLGHHPVVVLHGARQTGKTTLARMHPIGDRRDYRTLDDFATLETARQDPEALLIGVDRITLDEVQRHPDLLQAIKVDVDRDRSAGRFLITGSANLLLMSGVSESLAGRAIYLPLPPLTWAEIEGRPFGRCLETLTKSTSIDDVLAKITTPSVSPARDLRAAVFRGGYPLPALSDSSEFQTEWLEGYVQTYLERDLRQLSAVENLVDFRRLMQLAAARTGSVLNIASIASDAALTPATTGRYLNLLQTSFQILRVPAFAVNRGKRLIKSPKLLWSDTGLAAHLAGYFSADALSSSREWGPWLECWFGSHLFAFASLQTPRCGLFHWRTSGGQEVDFVVEYGRRLLPIEVKSTRRPRLADAKGLSSFLESYPEAPFGVIACECEMPTVIARNIVALPFEHLLLT